MAEPAISKYRQHSQPVIGGIPEYTNNSALQNTNPIHHQNYYCKLAGCIMNNKWRKTGQKQNIDRRHAIFCAPLSTSRIIKLFSPVMYLSLYNRSYSSVTKLSIHDVSSSSTSRSRNSRNFGGYNIISLLFEKSPAKDIQIDKDTAIA